jgi:nucleoside-diphosphate-sugar epimerase
VVDTVTSSMNTSNARIRERLGWSPRLPSFAEGIGEIALQWKREGRR